MSNEPCAAVIHHGPGHQTTSRCERTGSHAMHQNTQTGRLLKWVGEIGYTDAFDQNPRNDED